MFRAWARISDQDLAGANHIGSGRRPEVGLLCQWVASNIGATHIAEGLGAAAMTSPELHIRLDPRRVAAYLIAAGGLLGAVGSAFPWITVNAPFLGSISKNGLDGDGIFALGLGLLLALYAAGRLAGMRLHWIVANLLSLGLLILSMFEIVDVYRSARDLRGSLGSSGDDPFGLGSAFASATSVSVGTGLWLDLIASLLGLWGALMLSRLPNVAAPANTPAPAQTISPQYYPPAGYPQPGPPQPNPGRPSPPS